MDERKEDFDRFNHGGLQPQEDEYISSHRLLSSSSLNEYQEPITTCSSSPRWSVHYLEYRGVGLMLLAQVFSAIMNMCVKLLESSPSGLHTAQILFIRMSITTFAITAYLIWLGPPVSVLGARENWRLLVIRGIGGCLGVGGLYYSLQYLPLGIAVTITFLTPIVTNLGCAIVLREAYSARQKAAGAIALCGVILLVNSPSYSGWDGSILASTNAECVLALSAAFVGVFGSAAALTSIRCLGQAEHPLIPVNYLSATATFASGIVLAFTTTMDGLIALMSSTNEQWILLAMATICGFANQLSITLALVSARSARSVNAMYMQAVFAVTLDLVVFGTVPTLALGAGYAVVLVATAWAVMGKEREMRDCAQVVHREVLSDPEDVELQSVRTE